MPPWVDGSTAGAVIASLFSLGTFVVARRTTMRLRERVEIRDAQEKNRVAEHLLLTNQFDSYQELVKIYREESDMLRKRITSLEIEAVETRRHLVECEEESKKLRSCVADLERRLDQEKR